MQLAWWVALLGCYLVTLLFRCQILQSNPVYCFTHPEWNKKHDNPLLHPLASQHPSLIWHMKYLSQRCRRRPTSPPSRSRSGSEQQIRSLLVSSSEDVGWLTDHPIGVAGLFSSYLLLNQGWVWLLSSKILDPRNKNHFGALVASVGRNFQISGPKD